MQTAHPAPLTAEQLAAITAGGGYACCEDPATHSVYHLIQQPARPTIDDEYVRQKIEEAYADAEKNGFQPLNMSAIKQELQGRLASKR
jgi:hypothetical protein